MPRPTILVDPLPRTLDLIMEPSVRKRLEALGRVVLSEDRQMPDEMVEELLPETTILVGQTPMPRDRLDRAPRLKAIINVETNFLPNIDYGRCQERGIWVLTPGSAFAGPVAEAALGMAIDLGRGITAADRAFRAGRENYGLAGNAGTLRLEGATIGIIGFGDLGRHFRRLVRPFRNRILVSDPWLPAEIIEREDCEPATLDEIFEPCRFVFVFASVTSENEGLIGRKHFEAMQPGSCFLLMSRAAVVDFPAMQAAARSGRIRVASDVFPVEPVAADDEVRRCEGILLSAHRTGGTLDAFHAIGAMTVADSELIMRGLPPQLCRRADPATASRLRSMPVKIS